MRDGPSLWRGPAPLLLASTSETRRQLLAGAGLSVETEAPGIDERAVEAEALGSGPRHIARRLAAERALAVSRRHPDRIVIGADQTLACAGRLFHKPADRAAAHEHLTALSGRTHELCSAFAVATGGAIVHEGSAEARLTLRALTSDEIARYLDLAGDAAWQSVGAYQVERFGIHLLDRIEGDHSTILGLPLIPLLDALREMKLLAF
jgi:septum formation protein